MVGSLVLKKSVTMTLFLEKKINSSFDKNLKLVDSLVRFFFKIHVIFWELLNNSTSLENSSENPRTDEDVNKKIIKYFRNNNEKINKLIDV